MDVGVTLQPAIMLGLVGIQVVEDDMDLEAFVEIDQLVSGSRGIRAGAGARNGRR